MMAIEIAISNQFPYSKPCCSTSPFFFVATWRNSPIYRHPCSLGHQAMTCDDPNWKSKCLTGSGGRAALGGCGQLYHLPAVLLLSCLLSCSAQPDTEQAANQPSGKETTQTEPDLPPGRWNKRRPTSVLPELDEDQIKQIARLRSLGYAAGSRESVAEQSITVHVETKVQAGLNFYTSAHAPGAILMDMAGNELHRWNFPLKKAWPHAPLENLHRDTKDYWRRAYLLENGDILAVFDYFGLLRIDKDSKLLWARKNETHHALQVMPNGDIYALTERFHVVPSISSLEPIGEDFLSISDSEGNEKKRISLLACYQRLVRELGGNLRNLDDRVLKDLLHTNSIVVLDETAEHISPAFKAGNVLFGMRTFSTLAVLDVQQEKFVWHLSGVDRPPSDEDGTPSLFFRFQHDARILPSGSMLLFDNGGLKNRSTIWEFDPLTGQVIWYYRGNASEPFYSAFCGTAQRLPNGNTLITESDNGRAFEVTREREIVWEFYNPHRTGENGKWIAMLPEVVRLRPDFPIAWARKATD